MSPPSLPPQLAGWWVTDSGSRAMRVDQGVGRDGPVAVTLWQLHGEPRVLMADQPATWRPPMPGREASEWARQRLGYLQVELGTPSLGMTYDLMLATENRDGAGGLHGAYQWRRIADDTPREAVRLFPELGASYHEAVLGAWDDVVKAEREANAWLYPLATWLPLAEAPVMAGAADPPQGR